MKKAVLFLFTVLLFFGNTDVCIGQSSVDDAQKFAERCLNKVRNRRFRKLQESYPQALKDIERIKANATKDKFGWDDVAKNAPDWIEMMETFAKFPNHQVENKGEVIKFEITDYKPLLAEAKTKANEAHYQEGVKIMEENERYDQRRKAFYHFQEAMDFSDNHKEDIYQRAATIHYDEGVRIYNSSDNFITQVKAEEPFKKAQAWINPFKDINELMAKLYFKEAKSKSDEMPSKEEVTNIVFEDINLLDDYEDKYKEVIEAYKKTNEWIADYEGVATKIKELNTEAADAFYTAAKKHEEIHEFRNQALAVQFYEAADKWIPNYNNANSLAEAAKKRMEFNVLFYERPHFMDPATIGFASSGYMKAPFEKPWALLSVDPVENPEYAVREVGHGFVMVAVGEKGNFEYGTGEERDVKEVTVYISRKKDPLTDEVTESEVSESEYNNMKKMLNLTDQDVGYTLHKYSGTATYVYPTAEASIDCKVEIWDMRDPENIYMVDEITTTFKTSDKTSYLDYNGHPRAKPSYNNTYGGLKTKNELLAELNKKIYEEENIYKNCLDEIKSSIRKNVKYIHY